MVGEKEKTLSLIRDRFWPGSASDVRESRAWEFCTFWSDCYGMNTQDEQQRSL